MTSMRDAKIIRTEVLGNKHKRILKEDLLLPDGAQFDWIYLDKPKSLAVVALTPQKELVLVDLYRHALRQDVCELPAGESDPEDADDLAAAKRELLEETGYASDSMIDLGSYYVLPSETNRHVHFFLALDAQKIQDPVPDTFVEKYFAMSVSVRPLKLFETPQKAAQHNMTGMESLFGLQLAFGYLDHKPAAPSL